MVLNIAETHYYILNIVWAWKHNHNKDSRHVSPITDSQTVQVQTCTCTFGHETNSKHCLRNTALPVVYRTALWQVANVECFLIESGLCVGLLIRPEEPYQFRVCKSVHHHTFNWINQPDAATSQVCYLSFKYSSTCFGHPHDHHQELQQLQ
jgi:hypothetical protein